MRSIEVRIRIGKEKNIPCIEFSWNIINNKNNTEFIKRTLVSSIQTYQNNWYAFLNRFSTFTNDQLVNSQPEINQILGRKSSWLANESGWDSFRTDRLDQIKELIIISDTEFITLPLELLSLGNTYLGDLIPVIRKIISTSRSRIKKRIGPNSLFIFDDSSVMGIEKSVRREREILLKLADKKLELIQLSKSQISNSRFKEEISNCKFFNFSGHLDLGEFTFNNDQTVSSEELSTWNLSNLELVFLNGCNGLLSSQETKSLGMALLESGVGTVVGFSYYIPTQMAEEIGQLFWKSYLSSKSISKAIKTAKRKLYELSNPFRFTFLYLGVPTEPDETILSTNQKHFSILTIVLTSFLITYYLFNSMNSTSEIKSTTIVSTGKFQKSITEIPKQKQNSKKEEAAKKAIPTIKWISERNHSELNSIINQIGKFKSHTLRVILFTYLEEDHIIYNKEERISIIKSYISKSMSEENLEKLVRQEFGILE